ncbi:hypothetical protein AAC387_Pa03g4065 [Persea americana]
MTLKPRGVQRLPIWGKVEQQVRQVLKSGVQRYIRCGSGADLVECEKESVMIFIDENLQGSQLNMMGYRDF